MLPVDRSPETADGRPHPNALLLGPGGYRVADYVRAGSAMSVLFLSITVPMLLWLG